MRLKHPLSAVVSMLFIGLPPFIAEAQTSSAEETLKSLQARWAEARKTANLTFLESFYAKEFTVGGMNGTESSREKDLNMFRSGDLKPDVIQDENLVVHVYGDAALVTGTEHLEGTYKGHTGQFDLRFANTFVFRDGRWQIVRHQATQITKLAAGPV